MRIFARLLSPFVFLIFVVACSENSSNPLNGTWVIDAKETKALLKKESPGNFAANMVGGIFIAANAKLEIDGTNIKIIMSAVKGMTSKETITEETGKLEDGSLIFTGGDGKETVLSISGDHLLMKSGSGAKKEESFAALFSKK